LKFSKRIINYLFANKNIKLYGYVFPDCRIFGLYNDDVYLKIIILTPLFLNCYHVKKTILYIHQRKSYINRFIKMSLSIGSKIPKIQECVRYSGTKIRFKSKRFSLFYRFLKKNIQKKI
jgi:hypothetical protein